MNTYFLWNNKTYSNNSISDTNTIIPLTGYDVVNAEIISTQPEWLDVTMSGATDIIITGEANTSFDIRTTRVTLVITTTDEDAEYYTERHSFTIIQLANSDYKIQPAWKDIDVNITQMNLIYGAITFRGNTTYLGQFWKNPTEDFLKINLMEMIRDMIPDYPFNTSGLLSSYNFQIDFYTNEDYTDLLQNYYITALPDYSYDETIVYNDNVNKLEKPISHTILKGGSWMNTIINDTDEDYTFVFGEDEVTVAPHCYKTNLFTSITENPSYDNYKICDEKDKKYTLLYINGYGGWESLACIGNYQEEDSFNRYSFIDKRLEKHNYKSDKKVSITLNTGYVNDIDSLNISELFGSHRIFLSDGVKATECSINDNSVRVQSFERNGHKFNNYNFNISVNKTFLRR